MKLSILALALFASIIFATEPAISQRKKLTSVPVKVTEKDNGKTIKVKLSRSFDVVFAKECVGCAQVWEITAMDDSKVQFLSNSYSNKSCKNCTGGNQDNTFHFKAKKAGESILSFKYFDSTFSVKIAAKNQRKNIAKGTT